MIKIILASHNAHKVKELNTLLQGAVQIISLTEAGVTEDIEEPFFTFEENAFAKANYVFQKMNIPVMAEDSGLVVPALHGAPGVLSARYAGPEKNDDKNIDKLLQELGSKQERDAYFQTTICLITEHGSNYFTGICSGSIAHERMGTQGFGYDPVFIPEGYQESFGIIGSAVKNQISHRAKATEKFITHIKTFSKQ